MSFLEITLPMFIFLNGLGIHHRKGKAEHRFPGRALWPVTFTELFPVSLASKPSKVTNREKHIPAYTKLPLLQG